MIWIDGPPGTGKTTLVSSYLDSRKVTSLWYQVDPGDEDAATFFYYLGLAGKKAAPRRSSPLPLLTPEYLPGLCAFTRRYFEALFRCLKSPFVMVLDDCSEVPETSPFYEVMVWALAEVPEGGSVIFIGRGDIPAALTRFHANGAMAVIGGDEMALTLKEASAVARLRDLEKAGDREIVREIHEKSRGWAAGTVLMIEQAKSGGMPSPSLSGASHERIFNYFGSEVFRRFDEKTRRILLKGAFLPTMTPRQLEMLTGETGAGRVLEDLSRRNYFILKHPQAGPVYEFHPLFREFLLARAGESLKRGHRIRIQKQAAALIEGAGQVEDAADLLIQAEDWEGLSHLIGRHGRTFLSQGRNRSLEGWLRHLPREILEGSPWHLYWMGCCRLAFHLAEAREYFEKAYLRFEKGDDPAGVYLAWSGAVTTFVIEWDDLSPLDVWISRYETMKTRYPVIPSPEIEFQGVMNIGIALVFRQPHHPDLPGWVTQAETLTLSVGAPNQRISLACHLLLYFSWIGDFPRGERLIKTLGPLSEDPQVSPLIRILWLGCYLPVYQWFRGSGERCLMYMEQALELGRETGIQVLDFLVTAQWVCGCLVDGDLETARKFLDRLAAILPGQGRMNRSFYHHLTSLEALHRGHLDRAAEEAGIAHRLAVECGVPFAQSHTHLGMAEILSRSGRKKEALQHLKAAQSIGKGMKSRLLAYLCLFSEARMAFDDCREEKGTALLRQALALSREMGGVNIYFYPPAVMARLYGKALEAGIEVDFVREWIQKRGLVPPEPVFDVEEWPWPVKIVTLGRFALLRDGRSMTFVGKIPQKPLELIKILAASGRNGAAVEEVTETLWPDSDGDLAHHSLETTLYRLRKWIGHAQVLVMQDGRVALDPRYCWVDAWALKHILDQLGSTLSRHRSPNVLSPVRKKVNKFPLPHGGEGQGEGDGKDPEAIAKLTEKALALYRGPFLQGEKERPWSLEYRERLRNKFLRHLTETGRHWMDRKAWDKAAALFQRGIEADPMAEPLYRALMVCYQKQGLRAEALAVYHGCRKRLTLSLGTHLSPETEKIYKSL